MRARVYRIDHRASMSSSDGSNTSRLKVDLELCIHRKLALLVESGEDVMVVALYQPPPATKTFRSSRFFQEIPRISRLLASFGIEADALSLEFRQQILSFAKDKATEAMKTENDELKLFLDMNVLHWEAYARDAELEREALAHDAALEQAIRESSEDGVRLRAAREESIEKLKKVSYEGEELGSNCRICLDEFLVKEEVTVMPCTHGFHSACIVRWLKTSNSCPICRLEL